MEEKDFILKTKDIHTYGKKKNSMEKVNPLYENRLLVLLEDIDEGVFRQVFLDKKQFKKVSDAIVTSIEKSDSLKDGYEIAEVKTGDTEIKADVFIGMDSINEN